MSVNSILIDALGSLLPTTAEVYKGDETEYIVFNMTELPDDFADDDAQHCRCLVQVHLYAPFERNTLLYRREIAQRLLSSGFTRPTVVPAHDAAGQHFVFECEYTEAYDG